MTTSTVEEQLSAGEVVLYRLLLIAARNSVALRQPVGSIDERALLARTAQELGEVVGLVKRLIGK